MLGKCKHLVFLTGVEINAFFIFQLFYNNGIKRAPSYQARRVVVFEMGAKHYITASRSGVSLHVCRLCDCGK